MSRFFFHYREPPERILDEEGLELPDLASALSEAERAGKDILAEKVRLGEVLNHDVIEITDEAGHTLHEVALKDLIRLS